MKRRSQPRQRRSKNTYGPKRESGRMMYGPAPQFIYKDGRIVRSR